MQREITLNDIFLEIRYVKTNMVTKEEFQELKVVVQQNTEDIKRLKEDVQELKAEVQKNTKDIQELKIEVQKHTKEIKKMRKDIAEIKFVLNGFGEDIGMLDSRTRSMVVYGK